MKNIQEKKGKEDEMVVDMLMQRVISIIRINPTFITRGRVILHSIYYGQMTSGVSVG